MFRISRNFPYGDHPDFPPRLPPLPLSLRFAIRRRRNMAQLYFHYSNPEGVFSDRSGGAVGNLIEVHDHAARMMRSLIALPSTEDWRSWVLHVSDDLGEDIFVIPFASMLGKPH
jgi:hypothetical protein